MSTNEHESEQKLARLAYRFSFISDLWSFVGIRGRILPLASVALMAFSGCLSHPPITSPTSLTSTDSVLADPDHFWNQPAAAEVSSADFDALWSACKGEMYIRLFELDREDYREGLLTSLPMVSKQFFEPWRSDAVSIADQAESSLATMRRTVHFEVTRLPDGSYRAAPKVLVERYESSERRLTYITEYQQAFSASRSFSDQPDQSGEPVNADYWYPVRRDTDLEKVIATSIKHRLGK